jgi:hypothetical protein
MANQYKEKIIQEIEEKLGRLRQVGNSQSLFYIPSIDTYIYFRYSKIQNKNTNKESCFYGLRKNDLLIMGGKKSYFCFISNEEDKIFLVPFMPYESYFSKLSPASDGQYKTNIHFRKHGTVLDFANMPKFSADGYRGIEKIFNISQKKLKIPKLSHSQVQSIIGSIGILKGFDVWIPPKDRQLIDNYILDDKRIIQKFPYIKKDVDEVISEIDVIWLEKLKPISMFEVEHSTPIYSGLLRFNDALLVISNINFSIVSNSEREAKFGKEINRPTFRQSKLNELVSFVNYENIYNWWHNLTGKIYEKQ